MVRVCFVCLGNICRSPTAHGVTLHHVRKRGLEQLLELDSAGTGAYHIGDRPDKRSIAAAARRGVELPGIARQFVASDFDKFDYVLAMDDANLAELQKLLGQRQHPGLRLFRSFDPTAPAEASVPDPYFGGEQGFEEVLDQCERAALGLLETIEEELNARKG
jgi:protein-tyrosine phosphatase